MLSAYPHLLAVLFYPNIREAGCFLLARAFIRGAMIGFNMSHNNTYHVDLSIVIPAYNEEQRLPATLERMAQFLSTQPWRTELIVVDDGSTDQTVALCHRLAASLPQLRVIETSPNHGKGHAVRTGMLAAKGEIIVMFDADSSTPATELPKLLAQLETAPIAIGSRYIKGAEVADRPWWRQGWSRLCNFFIQQTLVPGVRDTQCGCKAFTNAAAKDLFARATVNGWAFDLEVLALANRRGYRVVEVPIKWKDDARSRVDPWRDFGRVIHEAILIKRSLAHS